MGAGGTVDVDVDAVVVDVDVDAVVVDVDVDAVVEMVVSCEEGLAVHRA